MLTGRGGGGCSAAVAIVAEAVVLLQLTGTAKGEATSCDAYSRSGTELGRNEW